MPKDFVAKITPPENVHEAPALWFVFSEQQILLLDTDHLPTEKDLTRVQAVYELRYQNYVGIWQNQHCFCAEIAAKNAGSENDSFRLRPLRQAAQQLFSMDLFGIAGRALQILQWDKNHQFCARCGTPMQASLTERVKTCKACNLPHYPRISPSVIVLIQRGREVLLARSPHFQPGIYGAIAGFVEPGETAEETAEREVMEEVGLRIKNLQYRFSQPWPFPDSLMLAYTAQHAAGEIVIDGIEIEDAGWYTRDNLPLLPSSLSIARKLIDLFIHDEI